MQWKAHATRKRGDTFLLSDVNSTYHVGTWTHHHFYGDVWETNTGVYLRDEDIAFYSIITPPPIVEVLEHIMYQGEENV